MTGLRSEHNRFRYRTGRGIAVRFGPLATDRERRLVDAAARITGTRSIVSDVQHEGDDSFASVAHGPRRGPAPAGRAGRRRDRDPSGRHAAGIAVDDGPPMSAAEIELPRWLREQTVCITAHRHGRVVETFR